jgi:large subunit ribosomal protein L3
MKKSLFGKKIGMSQFIQDDGTVIPVTVCELGPCVVVQKKTVENDGYSALKVGYFDQIEKRLPKPLSGDYKKKNITPRKFMGECEVFDESLDIGSELNCSLFEENDLVNVSGVSKGHGFTGVMKRYGFGGGKKTHGSHHHRAPGSIGACAYPGEVWKGQRMPGRHGNKQVTVKNLKIVKVFQDKNIVLISGSIPGRRNSLIKVVSK